MATSNEWYKDNYLISTAKSLIQPTAVNEAFGTDSLYWAKPMDEALLKKMLDNSLCFGVYELPSSTSDIAGHSSPRQIGFARLVTDEVSFGYLTDVYILEEFQGKGLGSWLIKCIDENLSSWPELRRFMLITSTGQKFYSDKLNMKPFEQGLNGMQVMSKKGPGAVLKD